MTLQSIVAASPTAERIAVAAVLLLGVVLVILSRLRPATDHDVLERWEAWLTGPRERALLLMILLAAALVRTVGWSRPLTPPFWFSEESTLSVAKMLNEGS